VDEVLDGEGVHELDGLILDGRLVVNSGRLTLKRCAIKELVINSSTSKSGENVLEAKDCLFKSVTVVNDLAQLEYCTVLEDASFQILNASDSILCGTLEIKETTVKPKSCIRYSRIPWDFPASRIRMRSEEETSNSRERPVFYDIEYCSPWDDPENDTAIVERIKGKAVFGEPSYGVLHPSTPKSVLFGAEDGGEMGAYHHKFYALRYNAVTDKVEDFLPVGMKVALIPDSTLYNVPLQGSNNNLAEATP